MADYSAVGINRDFSCHIDISISHSTFLHPETGPSLVNIPDVDAHGAYPAHAQMHAKEHTGLGCLIDNQWQKKWSGWSGHLQIPMICGYDYLHKKM